MARALLDTLAVVLVPAGLALRLHDGKLVVTVRPAPPG